MPKHKNTSTCRGSLSVGSRDKPVITSIFLFSFCTTSLSWSLIDALQSRRQDDQNSTVTSYPPTCLPPQIPLSWVYKFLHGYINSIFMGIYKKRLNRITHCFQSISNDRKGLQTGLLLNVWSGQLKRTWFSSRNLWSRDSCPCVWA